MALEVAIEIPSSGITLTYWRVLSFTYNAEDNETLLSLGGYVSKEERDAGKKPLAAGIRRFRWHGADNPVTPQILHSGGAYAAVYAKVKQSVPSGLNLPGQAPVETNPFVNAIDVP
jgi:hypothetical protein